MDLNRRRFLGCTAAFALISPAAAKEGEAFRFRTAAAEPVLREHVRTIDRDARLPERPPFDRSIVLRRGVGSDLQAFGYEAALEDEPLPGRQGPWYLYRQDLFLEPQRAPFLTVYWKHALASIRVLDLIPGDQTWLDKK